MSRKPGTFRTGDRVLHKRRPALTPQRVTEVLWSTFGDWIKLDLNGVEVGPFLAKNFELIEPASADSLVNTTGSA